MIQRILKLELLLLFILTLASFYYFYFVNSLPDNIFTISSTSSEFSFFSYYFYSVISIIGFFVGPWIVLPFFSFALFYSFVLSKRSMLLDVLIFFSGTLFYLGVFAYLMPTMVGDGLLNLVQLYIGSLNLFLCSFLLLATTLFLTFRMKFLFFLKEFFLFTTLIPKRIFAGVKWGQEKIIKLGDLFSRIFGVITFVKEKVELKKESLATKEELVRLKEEPSAKPLVQEDSLNSGITNEMQQSMSLSTKESREDDDLLKSKNSIRKTVGELKEANKDINRVKRSVEKINYKKFVSGSFNISGRKNINKDPDKGYFSEIIRALEDKLQEFKIDAKIVNVLKGPVVDTFELELGPGVKLSKVTGLSDDLSLALAGAPIRIEYTTIGRTTVGIEVPRDPRDFIYLDEVLNSDEYKSDTKKKLPLAMGKNVVGEPYVIDLASAPHMLVAGETGSGKSVFIHSLLVSLLMQKSPQSLRLLMIDPKQIEMMPYSKLPHLLMPVITQDKEASLALMWACQEMENRYSILKEFGVRNIEGFNEKLKDATPDMLARIHQYYDDENYELPYIVVVVDEYADLILGPAGKEIENSICRLGQKARAAGIHVILTTQRPSANVVTGLIKANFPTRVSLKVASAMDSRVILDKNGAEKLLGNGDMLYKKGTELIRIHSSFVSVEEVENLVQQLSKLDVSYDSRAMEFLENGASESEGSDFDSIASNIPKDLFDQAVEFVLTQKVTSTSSLQRKFRIGYNKAADLADLLERRGVVGPSNGAKGREVLGPPQSS